MFAIAHIEKHLLAFLPYDRYIRNRAHVTAVEIPWFDYLAAHLEVALYDMLQALRNKTAINALTMPIPKPTKVLSNGFIWAVKALRPYGRPRTPPCNRCQTRWSAECIRSVQS